MSADDRTTLVESRIEQEQPSARETDYYAWLWSQIKQVAPDAILLRGPADLHPAQPFGGSSDLDILVHSGAGLVRRFLEEQGFYSVFTPHSYRERFQLPITGFDQPYAADLFQSERYGLGLRVAKNGEFWSGHTGSAVIHAIVDGKRTASVEPGCRRGRTGSDLDNDALSHFGPIGKILWRRGSAKLLTLYLVLRGILRPDWRVIVASVYQRAKHRLNQLTGKLGVEIALLGVDGTGKTTLANSLVRLPVPIRVIYMGADHDHRTRIMRFLYRRGFPEIFRKPFYRYEMLVRRITGWMAAKRGWVVIYDRHPAELLVAPHGSLKNKVKRVIDRLHSRPVDMTFWLTGDHSIIYERKKEFPVVQLQAFDQQYQSMLRHTGVPFETIDVTKCDFQTTLRIITDRIFTEVRARTFVRRNSLAAGHVPELRRIASQVSWNKFGSSTAVSSPAKITPAPSKAAQKCLRYLRPDEYAAWDALVDASPQGSVFCRSWYLRAVPGETRVLGYFEGSHLLAGMPVHYEKRWGMRLCCMPILTPAWGVVMEPLSGKRTSAQSKEIEILSVFARRLSRETMFIQTFHPTIQNWLPFRWNGFQQTSRFTYVLEDLRDLSRTWRELKDSCRGQIRKAQKQGIKIGICDPQVVAGASVKTFRRQGFRLPYSTDQFRSLCEAAIDNDAGQCFAAQDSRGRVHAAALLMWDRKTAYYVAGGGDPELRDSGATSLLIWHLISFSASRSAVFDFEGSDIEPIERFFRTFGATQRAYNYIFRCSRPLRALLVLAGKL